MFLSNSWTNISRDCSFMPAVKLDCGCKITITEIVYHLGLKSPHLLPHICLILVLRISWQKGRKEEKQRLTYLFKHLKISTREHFAVFKIERARRGALTHLSAFHANDPLLPTLLAYNLVICSLPQRPLTSLSGKAGISLSKAEME